MGIPNKEEVRGEAENLKGHVKEKVGRALGDRQMEDEGERDQARGKVREQFGRTRRKVGEAIEDVGENLKR